MCRALVYFQAGNVRVKGSTEPPGIWLKALLKGSILWSQYLASGPLSLLAAAAAAASCDARSWWGNGSFPQARRGTAARCRRQHSGYGFIVYQSVQTKKAAYLYPVCCLSRVNGCFFRNWFCTLSEDTVSHKDSKNLPVQTKLSCCFLVSIINTHGVALHHVTATFEIEQQSLIPICFYVSPHPAQILSTIIILTADLKYVFSLQSRDIQSSLRWHG